MADYPDPTLKTRTPVKMIIAILLLFSFFATLLLLLSRHYRLIGEIGRNIVKNPLQQEAVDLVQLEKDYRDRVISIIEGYLMEIDGLNVSATSTEFIVLTKATQDRTLDLTVPSHLKEYHLRAILILSDIERAIANENNGSVDDGIASLKDLLNNF